MEAGIPGLIMPKYYAGDLTDMASLTDFTVSGRFKFSRREQVRSVSVRFSAGSGTADIAFYRHDRNKGDWGVKHLWTETDRGTGADALLVIPAGDARESFWLMDADNDLVVIWANPASGTMQWIMEVETEVV